MAAPEPTTSSLASPPAASLTQEILHELIADIAIEELELSQFRRNRLNQLYAEQAQNGIAQANDAANGTNGTSPTKKERDEGLFSCVVCNRQIAAPRYASHLSGCMGLSGSRRGERRAAASAVTNGKPAKIGSGASSYGSDTDTERKNGANGVKRSASSASGSSQNKKSKPTPNALAPTSSGTFQPPHVGSHPLSKTMSLPASPVASPTASSHSIPPRPSSVAPGALPPHQQHQQLRIPSKTPAIPVQNGSRPPHPLAQTQRPPQPIPSKQPAGRLPSVPRPVTTNASRAAVQNDDRPDSDSEDSDSDLEILPTTTTQSTQPRLHQSSKTPRVPPPIPSNGVGGSAAMQRNGSQQVGAGTSQKQPRKGMKTNGSSATGQGGQGGVGRKAARPIAGVNHDSASSDEEASDGSGSD
ncbi:hypothetical protein JCM16303_001058 [Sporobolomyces ruberrimus]